MEVLCTANAPPAAINTSDANRAWDFAPAHGDILVDIDDASKNSARMSPSQIINVAY